MSRICNNGTCCINFLIQHLEVTRTTVGKYENGEMEIPESLLPVIAEKCNFMMGDYAAAIDEDMLVRRMKNICAMQP